MTSHAVLRYERGCCGAHLWMDTKSLSHIIDHTLTHRIWPCGSRAKSDRHCASLHGRSDLLWPYLALPEASWVHTSLLHPSGHPLTSFWAFGFSRYQPQPAGSPGRSNQPVLPSTCQGSGLHRYLAARARWKGRVGLGVSPKITSARRAGRRGRPTRPLAAGLVRF